MASTGAGFAWGGSADPWAAGWGSEHEVLTRDVTGDGKADMAAGNRVTGPPRPDLDGSGFDPA
jgi:hypothetical protein